jgi:hypothetical protein
VEAAVEMGVDPNTPSRLEELRRTMRESLQGSAAWDTVGAAGAFLDLLRLEFLRSPE